jgi:hypothetical protein
VSQLDHNLNHHHWWKPQISHQEPIWGGDASWEPYAGILQIKKAKLLFSVLCSNVQWPEHDHPLPNFLQLQPQSLLKVVGRLYRHTNLAVPREEIHLPRRKLGFRWTFGDSHAAGCRVIWCWLGPDGLYYLQEKFSRLPCVFNSAPRNEGVLGEWRYSSMHSWPRH